ncbi:hypothetical protein LP420_05860 [Massilia sp. B-10]|nr:hypothetical protein LP420_05860 [Massilia sp. B-10]
MARRSRTHGQVRTARPDHHGYRDAGPERFSGHRAITNDESTWHIPVILLTSKDMDSDRVWALRQGATAFMNKPLNHTALLELVNTLA